LAGFSAVSTTASTSAARGERSAAAMAGLISSGRAHRNPSAPQALAKATKTAQFAHPGRQSVAVVGDGGFAMLMAEFSTAVKNDVPVKIILLKKLTDLGNDRALCRIALTRSYEKPLWLELQRTWKSPLSYILLQPDTRGRPVGLAVDGKGGLLIAEDTGNSVWRVSGASP
jgi:hypothetical protein